MKNVFTPAYNDGVSGGWMQAPRGTTKEIIYIVVDGSEYQACEDFSHKMWTMQKKQTKYGLGFGNTPQDPRCVERTGLLGEMAFAKYFHDFVDMEYKVGGKVIDFTINGFKIDVKTSIPSPFEKSSSYEKMHITGINQKGELIPMKNDIYVRAKKISDDVAAKSSVVALVGFIECGKVESSSPVPATPDNPHRLSRDKSGRLGNHDVQEFMLLPIVDLKKMLGR